MPDCSKRWDLTLIFPMEIFFNQFFFATCFSSTVVETADFLVYQGSGRRGVGARGRGDQHFLISSSTGIPSTLPGQFWLLHLFSTSWFYQIFMSTIVPSLSYPLFLALRCHISGVLKGSRSNACIQSFILNWKSPQAV